MTYPADTYRITIDTPWGPAQLAACPLGLVGVWFDGQRHTPLARLHGPQAWPLVDASAAPAASAPAHAAAQLLAQAGEQLVAYLQGERSHFSLPLYQASGTALQQQVWQALGRIPRGHTCSYAALAAQLGRPQAVRAVATAVGRNPHIVIVPCHRVIGSDGALTGYAAGLPRKQALLALEGAIH